MSEPSDAEVALLAGTAFVVFAALIELVDHGTGFWGYARGAGEAFSYQEIAAAIRRHDLASLQEVKHFWGVAYLASAVAWLTQLSDPASLIAVSACGSIAGILLVRRLWSGWIAAFFAVLSWDWLQTSVLGGSETVFVALVFASFLAARRELWPWASLAASASVVVDPAGSFALVAVVTTLASRGDARRTAMAAAVGAFVVGLYFMEVSAARGDFLAHFRGRQPDWIDGQPFGLPFAALLRGMRDAPTAFALSRPAVWVALIVGGLMAIVLRREGRAYLSRWPVETAFAAMYATFLFTDNAEYWAWSEFPRSAIPLIPFALFALDPWLIKDRRLLRVLAPASGMLAAGWLIGFHHAWSLLRVAR